MITTKHHKRTARTRLTKTGRKVVLVSRIVYAIITIAGIILMAPYAKLFLG